MQEPATATATATYQTHVHVQYKQIESELLAKPEWRAALADVQEMTHALYQLELSKVFGCCEPMQDGPTSDPGPAPADTARMEAILGDLWQRLAGVPAFAELVTNYRRAKFEGTTLAHAPDDIVFATLFSYDLFYWLHPCLCAWLDQEGALPPQAWAALREQAIPTPLLPVCSEGSG